MGLNFFNIFLLGVSFVAFTIASGFITDASRRIGNLPEKSSNKDLQSAHKYSIWAAVIGWISVALLITALVLIIIFSEEVYASGFADYLVLGLLFFTLAGAAFIGVLSAITAADINKSKVQDNKGSYKQAIIATLIGIFAFIAVLVAFFIKIFYKPKSKSKSKTKESGLDLSNLESEFEEADMT